MKFMHEVAQLEFNKDEIGVESVNFSSQYGFLQVCIDVPSLNLNPKFASFIDLDVTKTLNLEIKFNT